jgi:hypothetical protein
LASFESINSSVFGKNASTGVARFCFHHSLDPPA